MYNQNHEHEVEVFLQQQKEAYPDEYKHVCDKYPVQTAARQRFIRRRREMNVGLLGLGPSRISLGTAAKYDLEAEQREDGEG